MDGASVNIVSAIGISVVTAAILAFAFKQMRLPSLLAYIVAGLLLSLVARPLFGETIHQMEVVSHLGLVFLLFIIGLEMDLRGVFKLGPRVAAAILLQAPVAVGVVLFVQWLAYESGIAIPGLGIEPSTWFYYAVACALGSTAIVVKLLDDRFDLTSQAGRLTILTLVAEDIVAVLALSYAKASSGTDANIALMLGGGAMLMAAIVVLARFVLSRVMAQLARSPDLLTLVSLAWCFLCAELMHVVGLSAEMGALIAGLTLGQLPQRMEILAKVLSLRDFFLALFFVALGMLLPVPTVPLLLRAVSLAAIVLIVRIVLFTPTLLYARQGPIVSLAAPINLSQLSEFSLLLIPIGIAQGQLAVDDTVVISYALMISVVVSAFAIPNNYRIALFLARIFRINNAPNVFGADASNAHSSVAGTNTPDIIVLGYFRNAEAMTRLIKETDPDLIDRILVIDFNLDNHPAIRAHGLQVTYGDISNPQTLRHFCVGNAKVVVSTISDTFLRGVSNVELAESVRLINPAVRFIATAVDDDDAVTLGHSGAHHVVCPPEETASAYGAAIRAALGESFA